MTFPSNFLWLDQLGTIDRAIRTDRRVTAATLAARLGVVERTVHRLLACLRELGAPLAFEPDPTLPEFGWRYDGRWNLGRALAGRVSGSGKKPQTPCFPR